MTRSVIGQVVGTCKTEASQKAIPLHEDLIEALKGLRQKNPTRRRRIGCLPVRVAVEKIRTGDNS